MNDSCPLQAAQFADGPIYRLLRLGTCQEPRLTLPGRERIRTIRHTWILGMFWKTLALAFLIGSLATTGLTFAADHANVPEAKQTKLGLYLTPKEAFDMKSKGGDKVLFIDVRTQPELEFVGFADSIDYNIPYVVNDLMTWDEKKARFTKMPNSNFLVSVEDKIKARGLDKNSTIILMCRSGDRSAHAADLLASDGYTHVYSVTEGFEGDQAKGGPRAGQRVVNGWKNAGLPWSYKLDKAKMYFE